MKKLLACMLLILLSTFCWVGVCLAFAVAIVGDSTTCGFGANPDPGVSPVNGLAYAYYNTQPAVGVEHLYNWNEPAGNPYAIPLLGNGLEDQSGANYANIPSVPYLLELWLKNISSSNAVYNFGGSGWTAGDHVSNNSIAALAIKNPRPDIVFIATGINSAKDSQSQQYDVTTLINQCITQYNIDGKMKPVLVKLHNVAVDSVTGTWSGVSNGGSNYSCPFKPDNITVNWVPMPYWTTTRAGIDTLASANYGAYTASNGPIPVLDLGTANGVIDVTKQYDPFHRNAAGYADSATKYEAFLSQLIIAKFPTTRSAGAPLTRGPGAPAGR